MGLEKLMGKTSVEVLSYLPELEWKLNRDEVKLRKFYFVNYGIKKIIIPKREQDEFFFLSVEELPQKIEGNKIFVEKGKRIGILSLVEVDSTQLKEVYQGHIPMIDIDTHNTSLDRFEEKDLLKIIKEKIGLLEIQQGLILSSGNRNYHFVGMGNLLNEKELLDFLGNCLVDLRYETTQGEEISLAHPAHIRHALNPLRGLEEDRLNFLSSKFVTLRVSPKEGKYPKVIDVYEGDKK